MCTTSKQLMGWTQGFVTSRQKGGSNGFMGAVLGKGGAENWLQVELSDIFATLPNTSWVHREQHVYKDRKCAVDFLIMCENGQSTCVELKVENLWQSALEGRVTMDHTRYTEVSADVARLQGTLNTDHANDDAYAIVITWSEEATTGMDNWIRRAQLRGERDYIDVAHERMIWRVTFYVIIVKGS